MNIDKIMAYESGELDDQGTLEMFAEGIKTGIVWSFQGHYGRTAKALIDQGYITADGEILADMDELH